MRFWLGWALILYFFQSTSEVKNICDSHLLQYWTKRDTFITVENLHIDQPIRVWFFLYIYENAVSLTEIVPILHSCSFKVLKNCSKLLQYGGIRSQWT